MNADRRIPPLRPNVVPAPRPFFDGPFPYAQPMDERDAALFLARTAGQPGHTFPRAKEYHQ